MDNVFKGNYNFLTVMGFKPKQNRSSDELHIWGFRVRSCPALLLIWFLLAIQCHVVQRNQ